MLSTKKSTIQKTILVAAALVIPAVFAGSASAAHRFSCKYTGTCYHFEAATHMIAALNLMDAAAYAPRYYRGRLIDKAMHELRDAVYEVRSRRAEHELDDARGHLRHFRRDGHIGALSIAAQHVNRAIRAEHQMRGFVRHHGHHGGHTAWPVVAPYPAPHPVHVARPSFSIGGNWGRVRIHF